MPAIPRDRCLDTTKALLSLRLLQDYGSAQVVDSEAHRRRKRMFMSPGRSGTGYPSDPDHDVEQTVALEQSE